MFIITFIIPTIGRISLNETIYSLYNLENKNWKAIIIFDGVKNNFHFNDERLIILEIDKVGKIDKKNNAGCVRNIGFDYIKNKNNNIDTEFIGFVDDDDTLHPDYVNLLFEKYSDYDFVVWRMKEYSGKVIPRFDYEDLDFGNIGISFCYKMNNLSKVRFKENDGGEDYYFLTTLIEKDNNYIIASEIFYYVKCNPYNAKKRLVSMSNNLSSIQINNLI